MNTFTGEQIVARLLDECRKAGYTAVAVFSRHKKVPQSMAWVNLDVSNSVFVHPEVQVKRKWDEKRFDISSICDELGIHAGAANYQQCQVRLKCEPQVWLLMQDTWVRIDNHGT